MRRKTFPLRIECLESRMPLAGNVTAGLNRGGLVINGDNGDNSVTVTPGPAGQYVVAGAAGTTINGQASQTFSGAVRGLAVQLRGGSDSLTLKPGTYLGSVVITDLAGSNSVNVAGANINGALIITAASPAGNSVNITNSTVLSNLGVYTRQSHLNSR